MSVKRFFRRSRWDRERAAEIDSYVQIETDENVARGMNYETALAQARRKFGNATLVREDIYTMNTMTLLDSLLRDARYCMRLLRHNPTFAVVALFTLAIGIGANTAVFSVVNRVILEPLNFPSPDELVSIKQYAPGAAGLASFSDGLLLSSSMYFTYAEHNRTFQSLGVWSPTTKSVTGVAEPEEVRAIEVSDGVLQALNVPPAIGRWFSARDQLPQSTQTVMLSYGYWKRHFGSDRSIVGHTIRVDAKPRQIIGIMPERFRLVDSDFDLLLPTAFDRSRQILAGFGFEGIGRLTPGVTVAQADHDIARMLPVWMDSWSNGPGTNPHYYERWRITPALRPLKQEVTGSISSVLWVVMGTIGAVMLIACANVTNLFLIRAETRQQELAVRIALGAGRARIVRELLVESIVLGLMGGALGLLLAYEGLRLFVAVGPANLPRLHEIAVDGRTLAFAALLSLLASIVCGLIPALKYAGPRVATALRSAGRTASVSRDRHRIRNVLVVIQVAMALVLLVSAGLMIRTFQALRKVEPGVNDPKHLQIMRISIPSTLVPDPRRVVRMQNEIAERLKVVPGVTAAGFGNQMPMEGFGSNWDIIFDDTKASAGKAQPLRLFKYLSPGFLNAAGTRIVAGRDLTWSDVYGRTRVVLISQNLARERWGSPRDALGKHLREFENAPWLEIIGVVQDVRENGLQEPAPAIVYWPPFNEDAYGPGKSDAIRFVTFVVRSSGAGSATLLRQIQQAVWSVEASLPVASTRTMQEVFDRSLSRTSFTLIMLAISGAMALVLGIVGIYGVISYAVSQRRREIGIRLALGAQHEKLKRMFVGSGLRLAAVGCAIGLVVAVGLTHLMKSLLFGISPLDPLTYLTVPVVLAMAAALASYLPARRAASVDPVEVLKAE